MTGSPPDPAPGGSGAALADILSALPRDRAVSLGDLSGRMGGHGHALVLMLLSAPEIIPLVPSVAAVLGVPILLLALGMALHGEARPLPDWLARRKVPPSFVDALRDRGPPLLRRISGLLRPRWGALANRTSLVGWFCVPMAVILLVPIPFLNTPPALCIILMTLGLMLRDGLVVGLGIGLSGLVAVGVAVIATLGWDWLSALV